VDAQQLTISLYALAAYVKLNFDWDWPGAEVEFKRSLQLNQATQTAITGVLINCTPADA